MVDAGHGLQWTRLPEDSKEQLYHFLFHLRVTMSYLAAHPIGKKTSQTPADIAHEIVQLAPRYAFVRSGNEVARIYTADSLPAMDEYTVLGNYSLIKVQTREKYCRQGQVDTGNTVSIKPPNEPTVRRWEEV